MGRSGQGHYENEEEQDHQSFNDPHQARARPRASRPHYPYAARVRCVCVTSREDRTEPEARKDGRRHYHEADQELERARKNGNSEVDAGHCWSSPRTGRVAAGGSEEEVEGSEQSTGPNERAEQFVPDSPRLRGPESVPVSYT